MRGDIMESKVEHAGKYIAINGRSQVIAFGLNREQVRLDAICTGEVRPVLLYCERLKPWLLPEADTVKEMIERLRAMPEKAVRYHLHKDAIRVLETMEEDLRRSSRSAETHEIVLRLEARQTA